MKQPFLHDRRRALEEAFFSKHHTKLVDELRRRKGREERTAALSAATGIRDHALLERLIDVGLGAETVVALALVPLVEVAWVDGRIQPKERQAVLEAAAESGIETGSPAYELLSDWLEHRPDPVLVQSWREFVSGLCAELGDDARRTLELDVMGRARRVAEAAGGLLGVASVSGAERDKLWELERTFR